MTSTIESEANRHVATVDGSRIVYAEAGSGDPVVLLHGYPQSRLCWRHLFDALARNHRVIAPDWLGWGESDRPLDLSLRYDDEVARIGRFFDAVGVARANVVAHDYGAHLILGFAARFPERLERLVLLNSRAHRTFPAAGRLLFGAIGLAARTPLLERSPIVPMHRLLLERYIRRGCFDRELRDRYLAWMTDRPGRRWYARFFRDYALREPREIVAPLRSLEIPVAIAWGDRDPWCPAWIARELAEIFPQASLEWLPGADHFVQEERPAEVLAVIEDLLPRAPRENRMARIA